MIKILPIFAVVAGIGASIAPAATTAPSADTIHIDPSTTWGTWDGWGVSLAWWANKYGDRDDLADAMFTLHDVKLNDQTLPGLGLNIARYNLGACSENQVDGKEMVKSKGILPFRQMEGFWLDGKSQDPHSNSWNWNADAKQRAMLLKARDRGANLFELFSNSPMWWMCANDNPSGAAKAGDDNLAPAHYRDFAVYLATVAATAKSIWGIQFTTVEPFNESSSRFWYANGKQEGCHFTRTAQTTVLPLLRTALDERGLKSIGIANADENTYDIALATWHAYTAQTRMLIDRVNVHGYQGSHGDRAGLFTATIGKKLWNSEYGENKHDGLTMAHNLDLDLRILHPTAWVYWQTLDAGGWGLISADLAQGKIGMPEIKYYVLAQYSRHIRPGMLILDTGETDTVAAYDPKANRLVIVAANQAATPRDALFDLTKFNAADEPVARYLTEPKGETRYAHEPDAQLTQKRLEITLPPSSIETFDIENITR